MNLVARLMSVIAVGISFSAAAVPVVNPLPGGCGPDPFVTYDRASDYYYLLFTRADRIEIFRSRTAATLRQGESRVVLVTNATDRVFGSVWAPEMHWAPDGRWYIWSSARNEPTTDHKRLFVLQSKTSDPFDGFVFKGYPEPGFDAIDPTVTTFPDGRMFVCFSPYDDKGQWLRIRELKTPWSFSERWADIARPDLDWERMPPHCDKWPIIEGPFFLRSPDGKRLFIVYSANGCFCDDYALGLLEYQGGDPCRKEAWKKHPTPVFKKGNGVYGTGHASFFKSPDGSETWIAYHSLERSNPENRPLSRLMNLQKVAFDETGFPSFGEPVVPGKPMPPPAVVPFVFGGTCGVSDPHAVSDPVRDCPCTSKGVPRVIFDTDMITDFDDVGALACLHALADAGECEILATLSSTRGNASVAAIEVINGYYGRGDLPVGAPKGMGVLGAYAGAKEKIDSNSPLGTSEAAKRLSEGDHYKYRKLAADYPQWVKHLDADDAPDANVVYRRALATAPDRSVVICSVGFLTNLRRLLETGGDDISPLDGRTLVERKVARLVSMACTYPKGREYNAMWDSESSRIVFERWPTEVVFSDWQYGGDLFAGRAVAEMPGPRNPVKDVFADNIPSREEVAKDPEGWKRKCFGLAGRSAWDETAVLAAVRGRNGYFGVQRGAYRIVSGDGTDVWEPDEANGRHWRLLERVPKCEIGKIIDELICRKPAKK